jgi:hypothetical protein
MSKHVRLLDLIQIEVTAFVGERSLVGGMEERGERDTGGTHEMLK